MVNIKNQPINLAINKHKYRSPLHLIAKLHIKNIQTDAASGWSMTGTTKGTERTIVATLLLKKGNDSYNIHPYDESFFKRPMVEYLIQGG